MKTILKILLICVVIGCEEHIPQTQQISAIIDLTDADNIPPSAKDIVNYLDKSPPSDGLGISLRYVSETRYTPKFQFILQQSSVGWLSNEDVQRRKKKKLLQQFKDTLERHQTAQSPRSEIFRLVCNELTDLSKKDGKKKLLLFSDLKENSFFSVYHQNDVYQLLNQREKVVANFLTNVYLPEDLSGISLHIIYSPNLQEDKVFTAMINLYQSIFEKRGVTLYISNEKKVVL